MSTCVEVCVEVKCVHVSLRRSVSTCVEVKCVHVCRSVCRGEVFSCV